LLNDKCKPESLERDGRPGWRFPQTAGCKARTCFVDVDFSFSQSGPFHNGLDIEQKAKFGQKKLALNTTNKSFA